MPPDATESAEMTRILHHLVTEVARVHRGESDGAPVEPYSREEFAAALPIWKRLLDLSIVALLFPFWLPIMTLSRALGRQLLRPGLFFTGNRGSDSRAAVSCS